MIAGAASVISSRVYNPGRMNPKERLAPALHYFLLIKNSGEFFFSLDA
jgi:hypothetical protein